MKRLQPSIYILGIILSFFSIHFTFAENGPPSSGFIPNKGQIANEKGDLMPEIHFKVEQGGLNAYFKSDGIIYHLYRTEDKTTADYSKEDWDNFNKGNLAAIGKKVYFFRIDFELINSNRNAVAVANDKHSVLHNYYLGHCPQGITGVEEYGEIIYKNVYPNIDLKYYYVNNQLKYEFIVHPGGDPTDIKFRYNGSTQTTVKNDQLSVENIYNNITEDKPFTYIRETEKEVRNTFGVNDGIVSFNVEGYDKSSTLVIDPTITWATYYNNFSSSDFHCNSAFDSNGKIYSAFATYAAAWPTVNAGSGQYYDSNRDGISDLIVLGFNADYSVQWATYYGGTDGDYLCGAGGDYGKTLGVDQNNNLYVAGYASYASGITFPTQASAAAGSFYQDQTHIYGGDNPFLLKFNSNGVRQWATIFNHEQANTNSAGIKINGICVSGTKVYFTGSTYRFNSNDIPLRTLAGGYNQSAFLGAQDAFVGRFDDNCILEWSTYFNSGTSGQQAYKDGADVHVDASGNLLLVGHVSGSSNTSAYLLNPGGGAYYQSTISGSTDVYIARFNSSMQPQWATYYGGTDLDRVSQVNTDASGNILVALRTVRSNNLPVYNPGGGAYYLGTKPTSGTNDDGAVLKFSNAGVRQWATYIGGTSGSQNSATGIAADANGSIYMIGYTNTTDFPVLNEAGSFNQATTGGANDLVYMKFSNAHVLQWSSYYGSTGSETCYGVKLATSSSSCSYKQFHFFGTSSSNIPTVNPGSPALYQNTSFTTNANACMLMTTSIAASSTAASSIGSSPVNACAPGFNTNLSVNGGSLGAGASWNWYSGSCGGTLIGTGTSINVSPSSSTVYYVRAEGTCNTTACATITINPPSTVTANITASANPNCFGSTDGSATVTAGGGNGSYGYSWAPSGGTGATAGSLAAGTYTVTVTDGNSCSASNTVTLTAPAAVTATVNSATDVSCNGGNNGSIDITAGGGNGSYTYSWLPSGGSSATANNLTANTYTVTVTDGNGCTGTAQQAISQPSALNANISASTNVLCFGGNNGDATVNASGGTINYTYSWAPSGGSGTTASNLTAGTYTVTVTDANSCTQTSTVTITEPTALTCNTAIVNYPTSDVASDGSLSVTASGGTTGYTYLWSPSGGTGSTATGLSASTTYTVTVTDANGCTCESTQAFTNMSTEDLNPISLDVYPNPGSESMIVQLNGNWNNQDVQIRIYDISGKQLYNQRLNAQNQVFDMSSYSSGIYMVNIITTEKTYTRKWIKK